MGGISMTRTHSNMNEYPPGTLLYEREELRLALFALCDEIVRPLTPPLRRFAVWVMERRW